MKPHGLSNNNPKETTASAYVTGRISASFANDEIKQSVLLRLSDH